MTTISHLYSLLLIKQSTNLVLSLQQGLTLNCYLILTVLLLLILPPLLLQVSLCQTKSLHPCINLKGICVAVCGSCSLRSLGFSVCEGKPSLSLSLSISLTDTHTHTHTQLLQWVKQLAVVVLPWDSRLKLEGGLRQSTGLLVLMKLRPS